MKSSKKAAVGLSLQVLIELILISVAAVSMATFVNKLQDHTEIQQRVVVREAAMLATVLSSSPSSAWAGLVHPNIPIEKYNFDMQDNQVRLNGLLSHSFVGLGPGKPSDKYAGFLITTDDQQLRLISAQDEVKNGRLCSPFKITAPVRLDAGLGQGVNEEQARAFIHNALKIATVKMDNPPLNELFSSKKVRTDHAKKEGVILLSLQFESPGEPVIRYALNAKGGEQSKNIACQVSNAFAQKFPLPIVPVNTHLFKEDDPAMILENPSVGVQVVIPMSQLSRFEKIFQLPS